MSDTASISPPPESGAVQPPTAKKPGAKRKPHRKSRTGCKQCRASRVKCDETKPCCGYCTRHSVQCSYLTTEPNILAVPGLPVNTRHKTGERTSSPTSDHGAASGVCNSLHMKDLELLLHFTTATAPSLSLHYPASLDIWATVVPHEALNHPFLMHGIFAISALHLSHIHALDPVQQQEYALLAAKHQSIALPSFRVQAATITEQNCAAVFLFSTLLVLHSMAMPCHSSVPSLPGVSSNIFGLPDWIHMLRGVDAVTQTRRHMFQGSRLEPLVDLDRFPTHLLSSTDELALNTLASLFTIPSACSVERLADLEVYQEALGYLKDSFSRPVTPYMPSKPLPYLWFTRVSEKFLDLLVQTQPEALILLAYVCVIFKRLEPCWVIDGLADKLMSHIVEHLCPDWRFWIEWPLRELGWDPFV